MDSSKACNCSSEKMERNLKKRWKKYKMIGQSENGNVNGYQCEMAVNKQLSKLINSSGEIEGRIKRTNGDIKLDLSLVDRTRSRTMGRWSRLFSSSCFVGRKLKEDTEKFEQLSIFRKMDYLESELDGVAKKIKKEAKKKIAAIKEAEEAAIKEAEEATIKEAEEEAAAQEDADDEDGQDKEAEDGDGGEGEDGGDMGEGGEGVDEGDKGDNGNDEITVRSEASSRRMSNISQRVMAPCCECGRKFKVTSTKVQKEIKIGPTGQKEDITVTTKETVKSNKKQGKRTTKTKEDHKFDGGGGFKVKAQEKVKCKIDGKYTVSKTEKIKGKKPDDNLSGCACGCPTGKHKDVKTERIVTCDGTVHDIKTETTDKVKGNKHSTTIKTKHKTQGEDCGVIFEKRKEYREVPVCPKTEEKSCSAPCGQEEDTGEEEECEEEGEEEAGQEEEEYPEPSSEADEDVQDADTGNDTGTEGESCDESPKKYKGKSKIVRKSNVIGACGQKEEVTVTTKEKVSQCKKKDACKRVTLEDHVMEGGGGYKVRAKENSVTSKKDGKFTSNRCEKIKGKSPKDDSECGSAKRKHRDIKKEHIVTCEGEVQDIETDTIEKVKGNKRTTKTRVVRKSDGGEAGASFEKCVTTTKEG